MLLCTVDLIERCQLATVGENTTVLDQSHLFKTCMKKLYKKLVKLIQSKSQITGQLVFTPELVTETSYNKMKQTLTDLKLQGSFRLVTLATCPTIFDRLKN